jgi:hypothetical protein
MRRDNDLQFRESVLIDFRLLLRTIYVGVFLQLVLAVAAYDFATVHDVYLFAGMMISATAAYLYGMGSGRGYFPDATGGAIVGGVCALIGVGALVLMHGATQSAIPSFTAICVLTGTVGGLFGRMAAKLRAMGF